MTGQHTQSPIAYSCYYTRNRTGEQFVPDHVFSLQLSGTLTVKDGQQQSTFCPGDFRFIRRNQLLKFTKEPPADGVFKSISIYLRQPVLAKIAAEMDLQNDTSPPGFEMVMRLNPSPLYEGFMNSILPYAEDGLFVSDELGELKQREAVLILLRSNPQLKSVLFYLKEPGKIDLEEFMNRNYHFNVHLNRFAYLTGRSLATFKRDFQHIFNTSPSKWLLQKRLHQAYYLLKEEGLSATEIYTDLGFQDLSHFSYAFKNAFGVSPSKI